MNAFCEMHRVTPETRLSIRIDSGMGKIGASESRSSKRSNAEGSISGASRFTGLSYPGARLVIKGINKALGEPAVSAVKGGRKGGGAALTPAGTQLVQFPAQLRCVSKPWRYRNVGSFNGRTPEKISNQKPGGIKTIRLAACCLMSHDLPKIDHCGGCS